MSKSTDTLVDRRLLSHLVDGIQADLTDEQIKAHLANAARSHLLLQELLKADPTRVDIEAFRQALRGQAHDIRRFAPGVLDQVRALGGQFTQALQTEIPGGETLESQRDRVIKFWDNWVFKPKEAARLTISPSLVSEVIYLPTLAEGSLKCTWDKVEDERRSAQEVINSLPRVPGLQWIVGNTPTVNRVLANHLKETGDYLLSNFYTWTTDWYNHPQHGLHHLVAGYFYSSGVYVLDLRPDGWLGFVGLLVLGVPED